MLAGGLMPDDLFNKIKNYINTDLKVKMNFDLAGNIRKEYELFEYKKEIEEFIVYIIEKSNKFPKILDKRVTSRKHINRKHNCPPLILDKLWVNFQAKHEFNPTHTHAGIFSFILFMQLPFDINEQTKNSPGIKSNCDCAASLEFLVLDHEGTITPYRFKPDRTWEKKCLVFSATTPHCVYPFYGVDDYRITISGNLVYDF